MQLFAVLLRTQVIAGLPVFDNVDAVRASEHEGLVQIEKDDRRAVLQ